jgi:hypothetical protein
MCNPVAIATSKSSLQSTSQLFSEALSDKLKRQTNHPMTQTTLTINKVSWQCPHQYQQSLLLLADVKQHSSTDRELEYCQSVTKKRESTKKRDSMGLRTSPETKATQPR